MNLFNIQNSLKMKVDRKWSTIYWAIDAHGTIFIPHHTELTFYVGAKEVLSFIGQRDDMKIILWTSSHANEIRDMMKLFDVSKIRITAINDNPFEADTDKANFDEKFYCNILLDDKSSFDGKTDWLILGKKLEQIFKEKIISWDDNKILQLKNGIKSINQELQNLITF